MHYTVNDEISFSIVRRSHHHHGRMSSTPSLPSSPLLSSIPSGRLTYQSIWVLRAFEFPMFMYSLVQNPLRSRSSSTCTHVNQHLELNPPYLLGKETFHHSNLSANFVIVTSICHSTSSLATSLARDVKYLYIYSSSVRVDAWRGGGTSTLG